MTRGDRPETGPRWADYEFTASVAPFPARGIPPPRAYPAPLYLHLPGRGTALVSDLIDQALATTSIQARLAADPYRLPECLKATAGQVLRVVNHGRRVFNGQVVGLRNDPLPGPVTLHLARFFDVQCTNEMCTLRITHRPGGAQLDPRLRLLTDASGRLRTLADSTLANGVGVSTIAVTAASRLVVVRQTAGNSASAGLLAPSGSGSLEPRDLAPLESLQAIARRGMERELREETGARAGEIRSTRITGFARWLERGAKPEFFGITELSAFEERDLAADERPYAGRAFTIAIDLPALGHELRNGTALLDAASLPARLKAEASLPLLLALRAAALRHPS
ncbi:MAG TPA: hypothetical protein VMG38_00655 [Trebonia sp.]|nr:hypothetical protein [Trebonia sp.]